MGPIFGMGVSCILYAFMIVEFLFLLEEILIFFENMFHINIEIRTEEKVKIKRYIITISFPQHP